MLRSDGQRCQGLLQRSALLTRIDLRVDASNQVFWNNSPVNVADLQQKMEEEVQKDPTNQPELRIEASPDSEYDVMAKILAQAKNAQMKKIGFVQ